MYIYSYIYMILPTASVKVFFIYFIYVYYINVFMSIFMIIVLNTLHPIIFIIAYINI